ncbi:MAG: hypothetical protein Kow0063_22090 [Anaerolineae bacterium]
MRGQSQSLGLKLVGAVVIALFLVTTWFAQPATGITPPGQDERPTLPPPPAPPGGEPGGEGGVAEGSCTGLRGTVINWGYQNEPGITVRLSDGGWGVAQITSTDGSYQFGPLGQGVAFLSTDLSPKQAETLRAMADQVAIRLRCDFDVIANLGLYSSPERPDPPATLTMKVSKLTLLPGETVTFYLILENGMPHAISHVFVTDYLPEGLTVTDVAATAGVVEVLNGRMVTVDVGELPQGAQETVQIVAQAGADLAYGTRLKNTASLLYAESAADQAWVTLTVGSMAAEAVATPAAGPSPAPTRPITPSPTMTGPPPAEETAGPVSPTVVAAQTPGQSDELLPVTGRGLTSALPVAGFVVALVLLGLRRLREPTVPD